MVSNRNAATRTSIGFRRLTEADLPLMHRWRNNPAITRWWEAVPEYAAIVAKYTPRISGEEAVHPYIALADAVPIGYLQWCRLDKVPGHAAEGMAEGSAAVDLFIGEDAYRGRGIGAAMLRAFLREIVFAEQDIRTCFIDPDPENATAIRSYERVGFRPLGVVKYDADGDPAWLMRLDRGEIVAQ